MSQQTKNKTQNVFSPTTRFVGIAVMVVFGMAFGFILTVLIGANFKGKELSLGDLGRIRLLSLPKGVLSLNEIQGFVLHATGGDDFIRIYLNNYQVFDNEPRKRLFYANPSDQKKSFEDEYKMVRRLPSLEKNKLGFLFAPRIEPFNY